MGRVYLRVCRIRRAIRMRTHMSMMVRLETRNCEVMVVGSANVKRAMEIMEKYRRGLISGWVHDQAMLELGNF